MLERTKYLLCVREREREGEKEGKRERERRKFNHIEKVTLFNMI